MFSYREINFKYNNCEILYYISIDAFDIQSYSRWWPNRKNKLCSFCVLQPHRTVKIQVGELESSTMDYQLNLNSRASDLLAQFYRQFLRSPENGKGKMRRYDITILKKMFLMHPAVLHESVCSYMWLVKNKNRPSCMVSRVCLSTGTARWRIRTAPCTKWAGISVSESVLRPVQHWHLRVFLLTEPTSVARSYVMKCTSAKETRAVHLQLSEQTNAYYTHVCALTWELTQYNRNFL